MAQTRWNWLPLAWPTDGETVWLRTLPQGTAPFQATFNALTYEFQPRFGGPPLPWYYCARWREL